MSTHLISMRGDLSPRLWQNEALGEWERNGRRGVVQVVTGGGKTTFAGMCVERFLGEGVGRRANIVVPTVALLDQWYVALQEDFGLSIADIGTYSGDGVAAKPRRINLLVINTARRWTAKITGPASMLIVDECHRAGSPENAKALDGPRLASLGLSATPRRDYDEGFETIVEPAIGPVIYEYDYNAARRDGVIVPFELRNVAIALTDDEAGRYSIATRRVSALVKRYNDGEDVEYRLKRVLRERASVSANAQWRLPIAVRLVEAHRGERVLVFHESISAADRIVTLLTSRRHRAAAYHSGLGPELRRDNLRLFRRGLFDVLVSCRALDEGVNVPEASVGVIASSTASTRQRIQRLGRVLRPAPGKSAAVIYTLYATSVEEKRLRSEAEALTTASQVVWLSSEVS